MDYQDQLRTLQRRRRVYYWGMGLFLPFLFVGTLLGLSPYVLFATSAVVIGAVSLPVLFWRCPKCGKLAFYKGLLQNTFSSECLHCGLELKPEKER